MKKTFITLLTLFACHTAMADMSVDVINHTGKKISVTYRTLDENGNLHFGPAKFSMESTSGHWICPEGDESTGACDRMPEISPFIAAIDDVATLDGTPVVFKSKQTCKVLRTDTNLPSIVLLGIPNPAGSLDVECLIQ